MRFAPIMQHRRVRQTLTLLLIAGALACMFPPQNKPFQWWAAHSAWVSLFYLVLGMALLILNRTRLMFVCLGCSAAVSFYTLEMDLRSRQPSAAAQPALKFACLHQPAAQAREVVGILLERGIDAVLLAHKPEAADTALLNALLRHWPNRVESTSFPDDTLKLSFYTRFPLANSGDSLPFEQSGGAWINLRPEFSRKNLWVYIAGEVRSPKSENLSSEFGVRGSESKGQSPKSEAQSSGSELRTPNSELKFSDSGLRTPSGPVVAIGPQYSTPLLVRAGIAGWHDSYLCQKTDEKGLKYPFDFRIYHSTDIDCVQSEMLRLANHQYLGLETILRLSHESEKPL